MENLPGCGWGDGQRQALGKGLLCFLLLSLFPPFHFPLCCDLSSGIQVNKCHIFQPIFTLGNAPSPSPLSCCSCFCYHCNCSPPTLPEIPSLTPSQSVTQSTWRSEPLPTICQAPCQVLRGAGGGGEQRREAPVPRPCPQAAYSLAVEHGQGHSKA